MCERGRLESRKFVFLTGAPSILRERLGREGGAPDIVSAQILRSSRLPSIAGLAILRDFALLLLFLGRFADLCGFFGRSPDPYRVRFISIMRFLPFLMSRFGALYSPVFSDIVYFVDSSVRFAGTFRASVVSPPGGPTEALRPPFAFTTTTALSRGLA